MLIVEADGTQAAVDEEIDRVADACRDAGAMRVSLAATTKTRERLWNVRRLISGALKARDSLKINHDVVVPRGRVPELFAVVDTFARRTSFGLSPSVTPATETSMST